MRLKVGQRYVTRSGIETTPMEHVGTGTYPFIAYINGFFESWTADGTCRVGQDSPSDLVGEVVAKLRHKDIDQMTPADYRRGVDAIWPSMRGF